MELKQKKLSQLLRAALSTGAVAALAVSPAFAQEAPKVEPSPKQAPAPQKIDKIQNNVDSERASYAYLLDMPIRSLTDVKGNALLRDAEMAKLKLESLQAKSENDLWLADLDILSTACDQLYSNKN